MKLFIRITGSVNYSPNEVKRRACSNIVREKVAKVALNSGLTEYFYEKLGDMHCDAYKYGNMTTAPPPAALQKMVSEIISKERSHSYVIEEVKLVKLVLRDKDDVRRLIKGSVQYIADEPLILHMYSESQLDLLFDSLKKKKGSLHLDATGQVVRNISDQKRVLYYALVIKPVSGESLVPIAELVTTDHSTPNRAAFVLNV